MLLVQRDFLSLFRTSLVSYVWSSRWSLSIRLPWTRRHFFMLPYAPLLGSKPSCTCVSGNLFSSRWAVWPSHRNLASMLMSCLVSSETYPSATWFSCSDRIPPPTVALRWSQQLHCVPYPSSEARCRGLLFCFRAGDPHHGFNGHDGISGFMLWAWGAFLIPAHPQTISLLMVQETINPAWSSPQFLLRIDFCVHPTHPSAFKIVPFWVNGHNSKPGEKR